MLWSAPGDINIATPLQLSMRWDITLLVQSVNLICAKESITLIGLNFFSLRQQHNHEQNFKTSFGQSVQV